MFESISINVYFVFEFPCLLSLYKIGDGKIRRLVGGGPA